MPKEKQLGETEFFRKNSVSFSLFLHMSKESKTGDIHYERDGFLLPLNASGF